MDDAGNILDMNHMCEMVLKGMDRRTGSPVIYDYLDKGSHDAFYIHHQRVMQTARFIAAS